MSHRASPKPAWSSSTRKRSRARKTTLWKCGIDRECMTHGILFLLIQVKARQNLPVASDRHFSKQRAQQRRELRSMQPGRRAFAVGKVLE